MGWGRDQAESQKDFLKLLKRIQKIVLDLKAPLIAGHVENRLENNSVKTLQAIHRNAIQTLLN